MTDARSLLVEQLGQLMLTAIELKAENEALKAQLSEAKGVSGLAEAAQAAARNNISTSDS